MFQGYRNLLWINSLIEDPCFLSSAVQACRSDHKGIGWLFRGLETASSSYDLVVVVAVAVVVVAGAELSVQRAMRGMV
jgi:hypothetical protein